LAGKEKRLIEIEKLVAKEGFWDNHGANLNLLKERTLLTNQVERMKKLSIELEESDIMLELGLEEDDEDTVQEVVKQVELIGGQIKKLSVELMLDGEDDKNNADFQPGDEAGIKSVTVRISPFNTNGKRHTSFASVFVYPELNNQIVVDIDDNDLRIDVYRASGAGGQHVNKTSSAVRITHVPAGIVVQCQQEKSQHRNKEMAMKVLKARLYRLEKRKQEEKIHEMHSSKDEIAWGSQIRSYVLHPYQMVKDHRINLEIGNVNPGSAWNLCCRKSAEHGKKGGSS